MDDKWSYDLVFSMQFLPGHVDTGSGIAEKFSVLSIRESGIIPIFLSDGTMVDLFGTAIANVRCFVQTATAFFFEILASLVTGRT